MDSVKKFESFIKIIENKSKKREIPELNEEYIYNPDYRLNKYIGKKLSIGEIVQVFPIDNDLQIVIDKILGDGRIFITYSSRQNRFIMGQLKLSDSDKSLLDNMIKDFKEVEVFEGVAYPTTKPTVKPGIKQSPGKPSPIRRDKPSVVPGPKAVTVLDLANKFLNLTKNNKDIISLLKRKYK